MVCFVIKPWTRRVRAKRNRVGQLIISMPLQTSTVDILEVIVDIASQEEQLLVSNLWSSDDAPRKFVRRGFAIHLRLNDESG